MKAIKTILIAILLISQSCQSSPSQHPQVDSRLSEYQTAYFASGCFWCVEAIFESLKGVKEVYSGYAGGIKENPTYKEVSMGQLKHAEAVVVYYAPTIISYETLVEVFFASHDPTTLNSQGPDHGPQYRSIAFFSTENEKNTILNRISYLEENKSFLGSITTEIKAFDTFYKAEDYHQDFEARNPSHGYIQAVSLPRLNKFKKKYPELLK